jgi:hypothetical protein
VLVVLSLLVVAALSGTGLAQAPEGSAAPGEVSEALLKDTGAYAAAFGVSLDEAVRRLQLQEDIGNLNAKLEAEQADTFAGLWIEHQPQYRVVAAFTHDGEATIKPYIEGTALAGIVVVRSANATLAELKSARAQAASMAESVGVPAYSALDVPANTAHLYVLDPEALGAAFESADVGLSPHVLVLAVREFPKLVTDIYGGWLCRHAPAGSL